ncbi:MAG TPA: hypothetical protein PKD45_10095 [Flavobacteriales bacterium]|nr:hypothetical protein [Flavobacteriales bacterium]
MNAETRSTGPGRAYRWATAGFMVFFGLMTVSAGSMVLLDLGVMRAEAGHYTPLVVWMNTLVGILYIVAGVGLFSTSGWTPKVLLLALGLMLVAVVGFLVHATQGLPYEPRTAAVLPVRVLITALFYGAARYFNRTVTPDRSTTT